jgi:hypothetical protein
VENLRRAADRYDLSTLLLAILASNIARHLIFIREILLRSYIESLGIPPASISEISVAISFGLYTPAK